MKGHSPFVRVLQIWLLALAPIVLLVGVTRTAIHSHLAAYDFDRAYLPAAHLVMHGASPYGPATTEALSSQTAFVYPPIGAFLFAPLAVLPHLAADLVMTLLVTLAVPALLWLLDVRDWRCVGAALLWGPVVSAIHLGTLSLPLAFGIAVVWRWRERPLRAGILLGLVIALKLFLWPLVVWLAATRRYRAALVAAVASTAFFLGPWIPLRGAGLASYPHMLGVLTSLEARRGFSPAALLADLGWPWIAAQAAGYAIGAAVLVGALVTATRQKRRDAEVLAIALAASLLLTPILWPNYAVLLLVPIALLRPRFGLWWLLPALLLAQPVLDPPPWEIALFLVVTAALVGSLLCPGNHWPGIAVLGRSWRRRAEALGGVPSK